MLDNMRRIRQPVTWAVLAIIVAGLLLGVVRLALLLFWDKTQVFAAFQEIGLSIMNLSLVLLLVALVCACLFLPPATPRAVLIARLSALVVTVGTGLQLICLALGVAASANAFGVIMEILGGLLDVALKALAAGVLWVLHRGVESGRLDTASTAVTPTSVDIEVIAPKSQPVWKPEHAAGTAWRTANDAAAGARPDSGAVADEAASPKPELPTEQPPSRWRPVRRSGTAGPDSPRSGTN